MKFYYSAKQADRYAKGNVFRPYNDKAMPVNRVLLDGKWQVYTECNQDKYSSSWDDVEYLGETDFTNETTKHGPDKW